METFDTIYSLIDKFICDITCNETAPGNISKKWVDIFSSILTILEELQPEKPKDGIPGFVAYDVPGKARVKIKTGKFLTRKLNLNSGFLTDEQIRALAEAINKSLFPESTVKLCKGTEITENYRKRVGGGSCMTGECAEYTRLYEDNPDRFQQLIMFYGNDSARAIVHKLDDGSYYMDRIYSSAGFLIDEMREYAKKQGWECFNGCTTETFSKLIISNLSFEDGFIPYMDSFRRYKIENGKMTIFHEDVENLTPDGDLTSTDGYFSGNVECECCGERVSENEINCVGDEYVCQDCYDEYYGSCERCGSAILIENMVFIDDSHICVCQNCADEHFTQCPECNKYFAETSHGGYCDKCVENHVFCSECGDEIEDGDLCENCASEILDKGKNG